jgi:hypothetical protein
MFVEQVKNVFGEGSTYDDFLTLLRSVKSKTISTADAAASVSKLFHGHDSLILGFQMFLPEDVASKGASEVDSKGDSTSTSDTPDPISPLKVAKKSNNEGLVEVEMTDFEACGGWTAVRKEIESTKKRKIQLIVSDPHVRVMKGSKASGGLDLFAHNTAVRKITLPHIEEVGDWAFGGCSNLTHVEAPRLTKIGPHSFAMCRRLKEVVVGRGRTTEKRFGVNVWKLSPPKSLKGRKKKSKIEKVGGGVFSLDSFAPKDEYSNEGGTKNERQKSQRSSKRQTRKQDGGANPSSRPGNGSSTQANPQATHEQNIRHKAPPKKIRPGTRKLSSIKGLTLKLRKALDSAGASGVATHDLTAIMGCSKRRVYDVTCVLHGIGLLDVRGKGSSKAFRWSREGGKGPGGWEAGAPSDEETEKLETTEEGNQLPLPNHDLFKALGATTETPPEARGRGQAKPALGSPHSGETSQSPESSKPGSPGTAPALSAEISSLDAMISAARSVLSSSRSSLYVPRSMVSALFGSGKKVVAVAVGERSKVNIKVDGPLKGGTVVIKSSEGVRADVIMGGVRVGVRAKGEIEGTR